MLKITKNIPNAFIFLCCMFFASPKAYTEEVNRLVTKICLRGFLTEMRLAGKKPQKQMGKFTCNCFLQKISSGSDISSAQSICKEEASKKFDL